MNDVTKVIAKQSGGGEISSQLSTRLLLATDFTLAEQQVLAGRSDGCIRVNELRPILEKMIREVRAVAELL